MTIRLGTIVSRETIANENAQSDWLILVPTSMELALIQRQGSWERRCQFEVCGFGPIAAAANAARMIERHRPHRVLLLGIAGGYRYEIEIGAAVEFNEVTCYGVGVGEGDQFRPAQHFGWKQWEGDAESQAIGDRIQLNRTADREATSAESGMLLTVTSAADNSVAVDNRLQLFPAAIAEDMEGFGVAMACHLSSVPCRIVRGISNHAGDRDKSNWRIAAAIESAVALTETILESDP